MIPLYEVWNAILTAPGYQGGFAAWVGQQIGLHVPQQLPETDYLQEFNKVFGKHVAALQAEEVRKARAESVSRRQLDYKNGASRIHRDIKNPRASEVSVLAKDADTTVVATRISKKGKLTTLQVADTQQLVTGRIVTISAYRGRLVQVRGSKIVLEPPPPAFPTGTIVSQTVWLSGLNDIFEQFMQRWSQHWERDGGISPEPCERLAEIVCAAIKHLPDHHMPQTTLMVSRWRAALALTNPATQRGPDSWRRKELQAWLDECVAI